VIGAPDLAFLPDRVRENACLRLDGVEWRRQDAVETINALADAGQVVVRLFLRRRDSADVVDWELPWDEIDVSYDRPDARAAVEDGRRTALDSLAREGFAKQAEAGWADWVLVQWRSSADFPDYVRRRRESDARVQAIVDRAEKRRARRRQPTS
jgi:hypothetical protein